MQFFVIGSGRGAVWDALGAVVAELGFSPAREISWVELRNGRHLVESARPLILVVESEGLAPSVGEMADFARENSGGAFLVYLAETIAPADYKKLARTGFADWIDLRNFRDELRELVVRLGVADTTGRAAKTVSFLPSKGGVGNTTILVEAAVTLSTRRKRSGARIAILDLNLQGGTVADALDLEPRFDLSEIIDRPERLDEQLIDIFTSRYSKNLDVFASSKTRFLIDAVKPEIVFALIDSLAGRYDTILLDLPVQWAAWTDTLLSGSDAVVVSGGESVPALRRLSVTLSQLDRLAVSDGKVAAVVNGSATDLMGRVSRRGLIERALANRRVFITRKDVKNAGQALDVGKPVSELSPQSRIVKDMKPLSAWIEGLTEQAERIRSASSLRDEALA